MRLCQVIKLKTRDDQYADKKGKPRTRITKFWMDCLTRQLGLRATAEKEHEELCRSVLRFKGGECEWLSNRMTLLANLLGVRDKTAGGNHDAWTDSKTDFCLGFITRCFAFDAVAQANPGIVSKTRGSFPHKMYGSATLSSAAWAAGERRKAL